MVWSVTGCSWQKNSDAKQGLSLGCFFDRENPKPIAGSELGLLCVHEAAMMVCSLCVWTENCKWQDKLGLAAATGLSWFDRKMK